MTDRRKIEIVYYIVTSLQHSTTQFLLTGNGCPTTNYPEILTSSIEIEDVEIKEENSQPLSNDFILNTGI